MRITLTRLFGLCLLLVLGATLGSIASAAERVTWYHHDLLGSPVAATDRNGEVVWREQYKPYGQRMLKEDGGTNKLWYTGKAHEAGTRLSYFGARWYHPEIGRFMSVDPVDFTEDNVQSFNRYAYANNNPYRYADPDGESPLDVVFLVYDVGKLGVAIYTGQGVGAALADVGTSLVGVASPVPGTGQAIKAAKVAAKAGEAVGKTGKVAESGKTYQTYTKTNPKTGEIYCGRTSGCGAAEQNIARRDTSHHMNQEGFGPAVLDKSSTNAAAIRGREQQLIDAAGGAKSTGGSSGNRINGISPRSPKKGLYSEQARREFGR